jgi:hypothetical protein
MKKIKTNTWLLLTVLLLLSCERDLETEGLSRITNYPVMTMLGDEWVVVMQGGTYTDPGATATIAGQPVEVSITQMPTPNQMPDPNVPGVYVTTYTATNEDGYSISITRKIGVISPAAAAQDLSGQYKRNAGAGGISTITRLGPGFYQTDNVGGVAQPGPATTVKFFHYEGNTLNGPPQDVGGSEFSVIDGTVTPGVSYSWVVINPGYGDALRTFEKL